MSAFSRRSFLTATASAIAMPAIVAPARAQAWPAVTKLIVPLPAGGGVDAVVRVLGEGLAKELGTSIVVENRPGAGGIIAAKAAAAMPADGSTLFYVFAGIISVQAVSQRLDFLKEFKPVTSISASPLLLTVSGKSPYKTQAELVAAIKANPGKLNFGHAGPGTPPHLCFELFSEKVGPLNVNQVALSGGPEQVVALIRGDIDFGFILPGLAVEQISSGGVRVLSSTAALNLPGLKDLPTTADAGAPGFVFDPWGGLAVPAATPDAVVARLFAAAQAAASAPAFSTMVQRTAARLSLSKDSAEFTKLIRDQLEIDTGLVKRLGLKPPQ